jgi:polyvinyl alcohol dehydrogenase (cytochrome)
MCLIVARVTPPFQNGWRTALVGAIALGVSVRVSAQAMTGLNLYEQYCSSCHSSPAAGSRAPDRVALSQLTPEAILDAITGGPMAVNAEGMTPGQKRALAEALALRPLGSTTSGSVAAMSGHCAEAAPASAGQGARWSGWGVDSGNSRFQSGSAAGLTAADVPRLKLKWAFGFPNGTSAFAQPAVAAGRLFVGSDNGFVYALDAATGCSYWSYQAQAGVRTAISIGPVGTNAAPREAIYFGDLKGNVYAVDAATGALVWSKRADAHPLARITGAPVLADGRLYVPLSSLEEASGANPKYECCTFRGGVVAYDARTGSELWRAYTIPDPPKKLKKNSVGTQLYGPAGASVWASPTVDARRGLLYVATGNAYNDPFAETSDAVMAFDLKTGKMRWSKQVTPKDTFVVGCGPNAPRDNCPDDTGPDFDFGNSPILRTLPNGRSIITLGQKSGVAWGLDPDREGAILWQKRVGKGSALGGMEWGSAADDQNGYFPVSDALAEPGDAGGLYALKLTTGEEVWRWKPSCPAGQRNCLEANSAAISVMPGVVFSGTTRGMLRAYSTTDGKVLWETDTAQPFQTVNGVAAKGGAINGPGPVIVNGMVYTNSGYAYLGPIGGALPGNVLLAYGVE